MSVTAAAESRAPPLLAVDRQKLLFSFASFVAATATIGIAFIASLPRPWWAILTVYVTAQPMAGAFRPKVLYRLGGILLGAVVAVALVPALEHSPPLLVLCLASWAGGCIYLAVLDRTPRAFLFQMAAFSSAVISFPYLDDPGGIFLVAVSRTEEMTVAIVSVTLAHALIQPWSAVPLIRRRAETFLKDASRWAGEVLAGLHNRLEYEHRRKLAADVTELGMLAVHLPFDQRSAPATRRLVLALQERLTSVLPLATGAADRLDLLRAIGPLDPRVARLVEDVEAWLRTRADSPPALEEALVARCRRLAAAAVERADWRSLVEASLCERTAEFLIVCQESRTLVGVIGAPAAEAEPALPAGRTFPLSRPYGLAAMAGLATTTAIVLYCAVWIGLGWPSGAATAAFAALITCSFAAQDDPAPVIMRYLGATLLTFPLAALYLFVVLPRVDGYVELMLMLAPALLFIGYIQADPARSPQALPAFSCLIVALGFLARFQADFATFINVGLAQVGGILTTLVVTKLFRSASTRATARRIIRRNWADLQRLADIRSRFEAGRWTGLAIDRLGQVAARMAQADPGDALHAADGLADLRIGRNVIRIRRALSAIPHDQRRLLAVVLAEVSRLFGARLKSGHSERPPTSLLAAIDRAIAALLGLEASDPRQEAVIALVSLRCTLFPRAAAYGAAA